MDTDDAVSMVNVLCWKAGVKPCRIMLRPRRGGSYDPVTETIRLTVHDTGWAVIHEVAHHVCHARRPRVSPRRRSARRAFLRKYPGMRHTTWSADGKRWGSVHHGPVFVEILAEMARIWYGDPGLYPWENEYASVRAEWERTR